MQHLIHRNSKDDQDYEENERSIKPTVVYVRRLEQRYMEEQKEREKNELDTVTTMVGKKHMTEKTHGE